MTHPDRTIVVELGRIRAATDLLGRNVIRISGPTWRHDLAERLRIAGCAVSTTGSDWLTVGAFEPPAAGHAVDVEPSPVVPGIYDTSS